MAKIRGSIVVNVERCKGCEVCMVSCPTGTIAMAKEVNGKGYNYAFPAGYEEVEQILQSHPIKAF